MAQDDENARALAAFLAKGGSIKKVGNTDARLHAAFSGAHTLPPKAEHGIKLFRVEVISKQAVHYAGGKYAGIVVKVQDEAGKKYALMSSQDYADKLRIEGTYSFNVNTEANPYPTGKSSDIKINGAIKTTPIAIRDFKPAGLDLG